MTRQRAKKSKVGQRILQRVEELLVGKLVQVVETSGGASRFVSPVSICTAVHQAEDGVNVELIDGGVFGFLPLQIKPHYVSGPVSGNGQLWWGVCVLNVAMPKWSFSFDTGPSREQLFDSLRLPCHDIRVRFTLEGNISFSVAVMGIERVHGKVRDLETLKLLLGDAAGIPRSFRLEATYRTTDRKGILTMQKQPVN